MKKSSNNSSNVSSTTATSMLESFPISFVKILDNPPLKILLSEFCEKHEAIGKIHEQINLSIDLLDFINRVGSFRSFRSPANRYLEATKIVYIFFGKKSKMFEPKLSKVVSQQFTRCSETNCCLGLFDLAEEFVISSLEKLVLEDFMKTEQWRLYMEKNPEILYELFANDKEKEEKKFLFVSSKLSKKLEFSKGNNVTEDGILLF
jgi:hypothetical protein